METTLPSAADLLDRADAAPAGATRRACFELGRAHRDDPALPGLLADLTASGLYGAHASLMIAQAADATDHLGALLDHADNGIAASAFTVAARFPALAPAIEAALPGQSKAVRLAAYGALRKHRNETLADSLLPVVRERFGPEEAAKLLSACSTETVAAELPSLAPHVTAWSTFAKHHHVEAFTAYAEASLAERSPAQWADWWRRHLDVLTTAFANAPLAWLDLLERFPAPGAADALIVRSLPVLLAAYEDRAWGLLADPKREKLLTTAVQTPPLLRRIAAEPADRIAALLRQSGVTHLMPLLLKRIAPSRRLEVVEAVRAAGVHIDDEAILALLPRTARAEVARRLLTERRVSGDAARRDRVRSHLPFNEVKDGFLAETRRSDVDLRARAYGDLVRAAALQHEPTAVTELLGLLDRVAKDQSKVHERIFPGLKEIRPQDWTPASLAALEAFSEACLASPSRSAGVVSAMLDLTGRLILAGLSTGRADLTDRGERLLDRLCTEAGRWELVNLLHRLPDRCTVDLVRRNASTFEAQADVDEYGTALTLASALDDAAALEPILLRAMRSKTASAVREAAEHLTRIKAGRSARLAELAAAFPSRPELFPALAVHRCDLLPAWFTAIGEATPTVLQQLLRPWNPALIAQWPPAVQAAYQATLRRIATDDRRKDHFRASAVKALTQVPGLPLESLAPFLEGENAQIRAVALAELHRVSPIAAAWEALPAHLDSGDAAVAAAVMERLAHRSRPEVIARSAAALLNSPKVGARKQAVRVLARHRVPGAADLLTSLWSDERLHTSVREAAAAVAAERLAEPWAQIIVEDTERFDPDVRAAVLTLGPDQVPAAFGTRYIDLLTEAASDDDPRLQVAGSDGLARWAGYAKEAADALVGFASDLDLDDVWAAAMNALCAIAAAGGDPESLLRAADLLANQADGQPNAEEDRDLPVRQRFERIVTCLAPDYDHLPLPPSLPAAIAERFPTDLGTRLLARTVDWSADTGALRVLIDRIQDPVEAKLIGDILDERLVYSVVPDPLPFVTALVDLDDPHAAVIAATVIDSAASESEWSAPWRTLLRRLRAHPATMVRTLAHATYTADEYAGATWHA